MRLVGTREAARMAQVPVRTLLGWVARGRVAAYRDAVSGRLFLPADEVERLRPERRLIPLGPVARRGTGSPGK